MAVALNINGRKVALDVPDDTPLLWAVRDELDLKGTKFGCGIGMCGACTCLLYTSDAADEGFRCRSRWSPYH